MPASPEPEESVVGPAVDAKPRSSATVTQDEPSPSPKEDEPSNAEESPKDEPSKAEEDDKPTSKAEEATDEDAETRRESDRYKPQIRPADLSDILPNGGIDSEAFARPSGVQRPNKDYFTIRGDVS